MSSPGARLPRLLYVGDVPIDSTVAGQALLHRLLREYPPDRLMVLEDVGRPSVRELRLPGVTYRPLDLGTSRFVPGRLTGPYHVLRALRCGLAGQTVARLSREFAPEAVLAVAQWEGWLAGAAFARSARLPLHLVVHDDWPNTNAWPSLLRQIGNGVFRKRYRAASSRMCVSPFMEAEYRNRYGVSGSVLLPLRDPSVPSEQSPAPRRRSGPLTVAYAGTLYTLGYTSLVRGLADALARIGGRLLLFTPLSTPAAAANGLARPHVELRGLVPVRVLRQVLREQADALFLPMSFLPREAVTMALNFPSKLTEYTAVALPIVVQGPEGSSAVRWARTTPDAALVVPEPGADALAHALQGLAGDPRLWDRLSAGALRAGAAFDYQRGRDAFLQLVAHV